MAQLYSGPGAPLSQEGMAAATTLLGVGEPELWALLTVETKGFGFQANRFPAILFERHIFHKLTGGRFAQQAPDLSDPSSGGWGASADQQARLAQAIALDEEAALKSASWGLGQVMGMNHVTTGFASATDFVAAMKANEDAQLIASARFINNDRTLRKALQDHDWAGVARCYNGPAYAANRYDAKLAQAFSRLSAGAGPDLEVRRAQALLTYLGYAPGAVDGLWGDASRRAVNRFQTDKGLNITKDLEDGVKAAIEAEAVARLT